MAYQRVKKFDALLAASGENDVGFELDQIEAEFNTKSGEIAQIIGGSTPGWNAPIDLRSYVVDTGGVNAVQIAPNPAPGGGDFLVEGMHWEVKIAADNTGPSTCTVGVLAAVPIRKYNSSGMLLDVGAGDLHQGKLAVLFYIGPHMLLLEDVGIRQSRPPIVTRYENTFLGAGADHFWSLATIWAKVVISGGGGGGGAAGATNDLVGSGGGAGGYAELIVTDVQAVDNPTPLTYGPGGNGGDAGGSGDGNNGEVSTYDDGTNVVTCNGGNGGVAGATIAVGGAGGTVLNGTLSVPGAKGANGGDAGVTTNYVGFGARSVLGDPGYPLRGANPPFAGNGRGYGGCGGFSDGVARNGDAGGAGLILIYEYQ